MGLSASLWTGVAGLSVHGDRMGVVGNNIANVNTVGFKGANMYFEDFISQDVNTAGGVGQVGRGVAVGAIYSDFGQGAFETTTEATDLAIGGNGFFKVKVKGQETSYYTRAGNFRFDKDGYLVDPHGYVLQGKAITETTKNPYAAETTSASTTVSQRKGSGAPIDIEIGQFVLEPKHTENVSIITNLDALNGGNNTTHATDPSFALFLTAWNGLNTDEPITEGAYSYQTTLKVYDEGGSSHNLTVYFDQASSAGGYNYWEYIVTIDPAEDKRTYYNGAAWVDMADTSAAGVMMIGTMKFNSAGQLKDMSAFTLAASNASDPGLLSNWKATAINTDGYVTFDPNFSGQSNAGYVVTTAGEKMYLSDAHPIAMDFGLKTSLKDWPWADTAFTAAAYDAGDIGVDATNNIGFGSQYVEYEAFATTSYSGSSSTLFQSQDGYTFGFLQNVTVDRDGILAGRYSNGIIKELYEIQLYDFVNKWGLRREGSNLFSETLESGLAKNDAPNQIGMGSISSNSLEQSNVDMAAEFVDMITTERGFQANSKVITTTDQMLQQVILMKR